MLHAAAAQAELSKGSDHPSFVSANMLTSGIMYKWVLQEFAAAGMSPVSIICLGWFLVLCLDVSNLGHHHVPHVASAALECTDCVLNLGFDVVARGDGGILDVGQLCGGSTYNLQR